MAPESLVTPQHIIAGITAVVLAFASVPALLALIEARKRHRRQAPTG